jgi:hypothetical protein
MSTRKTTRWARLARRAAIQQRAAWEAGDRDLAAIFQHACIRLTGLHLEELDRLAGGAAVPR